MEKYRVVQFSPKILFTFKINTTTRDKRTTNANMKAINYNAAPLSNKRTKTRKNAADTSTEF